MVIDFNIFLVNPTLFTDMPELVAEAREKASRMYLGVVIAINDNYCFVPFETNLRDNKLLRENAQWPLPSSTRPNAGLNFEKCLIINDEKYLEWIEHPRVASSQMREIEQNRDNIKAKLTRYIKKYMIAYRKNRHKREFIYRYTTLHCFQKELGLT